MKKQKPNKQCESCYQYGKGTCNAFKCIARNYCDWEDIIKPNISNDWKQKLYTLFQSAKNVQELYKEVEKLFSSEIQKEREKVLEEVREIIKKRLDDEKIPVEALFFGDCPNCGQEVNRKWVNYTIRKVSKKPLEKLLSKINKLK